MLTPRPIAITLVPKAFGTVFIHALAAGSRLKNLVFPVLFVFLLAFSPALDAQSGGRKRERKARKHGSLVLTQYKSRGHADEFAKGSSGRRGWISRLFKRDRPAWQYRTSGSSRSNFKENKFLFSWNRTKGKQENATTVDRQNRERSRQREHGNRSFKFKKHKRKK